MSLVVLGLDWPHRLSTPPSSRWLPQLRDILLNRRTRPNNPNVDRFSGVTPFVRMYRSGDDLWSWLCLDEGNLR
jgi:hypothetical protein